MPEVDRPIDVSPFLVEARAFSHDLVRRVPLEVIILDDWNTGGAKGPRLIYCSDSMGMCNSTCDSCSLFSAVGEDASSDEFKFRTSLCRATPKQLALFPSKQKYLNCKTLPQYFLAFVSWFIEECGTRELLEAEVDWVYGFRLLYMRDVDDEGALLRREMWFKKDIILKVLAKLMFKKDFERFRIVYRHARKIGLLP